MNCPLRGTCWPNNQGPTGRHDCIYCGASITNKMWNFVHYSEDKPKKPGYKYDKNKESVDDSYNSKWAIPN